MGQSVCVCAGVCFIHETKKKERKNKGRKQPLDFPIPRENNLTSENDKFYRSHRYRTSCTICFPSKRHILLFAKLMLVISLSLSLSLLSLSPLSLSLSLSLDRSLSPALYLSLSRSLSHSLTLPTHFHLQMYTNARMRAHPRPCTHMH